MNVLVVAPHPDDEVLGCGGLMAKYASLNHHVYVAIMTNAHAGAPELFSQELIEEGRLFAREAHRILGVKQTFFYNYPAPRLETAFGYQIADELKNLIHNLSIHSLYLPHRGDMHKDHAIIFYAGMVASRPINNSPVKNIYTYETLSETEWAPPFASDVFIPNVFENINGFLPKKLEAMKCFPTQVREFPHPRSLKAIETLAALRGSTVGYSCAEAFSLMRSLGSDAGQLQ
jgi:N-acetylglucosamine malate deacetylase 1